jgi:hypothetical protein
VKKHFINNEKQIGADNARKKAVLTKVKKHFGKIEKRWTEA